MWANGRDAGDLRRHRTNYDATVVIYDHRTVCLNVVILSNFKQVNLVRRSYSNETALQNAI